MRHENRDAIGRHDDDDGDDKTLNAPNRATEAVLAGLAPALGGVDPVAAGFAAGQRAAWRSHRRQLFAWRTAAAIAVVGMGLSWIVPLSSLSSSSSSSSSSRQNNLVQGGLPSPTPSGSGVMVVHAPQTPPTAAQKLPPQSVLVMRHAVSEAGLTGLAAPSLPIPEDVRKGPLF